uniref:Uncharacterized protein n=1 Tax=Rhodnius prolixus TaxID=13249 RepID=T1HM22_RHOPR
MFGMDNFICEDRLSELSELDDSFGQGDKISCSTPVTLKERRSCSLIDVSNFEELPNTKKLTISTDTIISGSQGSVCKDSGYVHSESNTSLNSTKEHKRLTELIEDLRFKDVLITELQESNHSLRLKYAEAENRIAELRQKCESHCDCCNFKSTPSTATSYHTHIVSPRNIPSACVSQSRLLPTPSTESKLTLPQSKDIAISPNSSDESIMKVKRWQDSNSSLLTSISSETSLVNNTRRQISTSIKMPSTSMVHSPIVQTRVIGDRSVRVSPLADFKQLSKTRTELECNKSTNGLQALQDSLRSPVKDVTLMIENLHNFIIGEGDLTSIVKNRHFDQRPATSPDEFGTDIHLAEGESGRFTVEGSAASVSYKNETRAKMSRVSYIDRKLEMERTIREGLNGIAERGRLESSMRYRPWETSHMNNGHITGKKLVIALRQAHAGFFCHVVQVYVESEIYLCFAKE